MSLQIGPGIIILIVLLIVLVIFLIMLSIYLNKSVKKLEMKYKKFMRGPNAASLEQSFAGEFRQLNEVNDRQIRMLTRISNIERQQSTTFSKSGVVKYDAFEDVGGKLSFVLALLDDSDNGIVLNAIHSKDNCFLYLKEIVNGESYIMLSDEEVRALLIAKNFTRNEVDKGKNLDAEPEL